MTIDALNRLQRIDYLIRIKGTGTADKLAEKLGVSRRNVYYYLELMKNHGAPIKFCHSRQSFYYDEEGVFLIQFSFKSGTKYTQDQLEDR